jgi:hypothetical protein
MYRHAAFVCLLRSPQTLSGLESSVCSNSPHLALGRALLCLADPYQPSCPQCAIGRKLGAGGQGDAPMCVTRSTRQGFVRRSRRHRFDRSPDGTSRQVRMIARVRPRLLSAGAIARSPADAATASPTPTNAMTLPGAAMGRELHHQTRRFSLPEVRVKRICRLRQRCCRKQFARGSDIGVPIIRVDDIVVRDPCRHVVDVNRVISYP